MINILVVDDCVDYLKSMEILLGNAGHNVDTAASRDECCTAVENKKYDIIIMDINIYDVDGRELVYELYTKGQLENTAIIFASTRKALINVDICSDMTDVCEYLFKPFSSDELYAAIESSLLKVRAQS